MSCADDVQQPIVFSFLRTVTAQGGPITVQLGDFYSVLRALKIMGTLSNSNSDNEVKLVADQKGGPQNKWLEDRDVKLL